MYKTQLVVAGENVKVDMQASLWVIIHQWAIEVGADKASFVCSFLGSNYWHHECIYIAKANNDSKKSDLSPFFLHNL